MKLQPNDDQYKVIKAAKEWFYSKTAPQVFQFEGPAGTGKSVTIKLILQELHLKETEYLSMAYTGQAAIVMRTKGFKNARSIHSHLYEIVEVEDNEDINRYFGKPYKKYKFRKRKYLDPHIKLIFIDEAYMVPDFMVKDILHYGVKVIVTGDSRQLPPVKAKPAFLVDYNECMHLNQLMRQSLDDPIIYLAHRILNGDPLHLGNYGNSVLILDEADFHPQMFGYADIIITGTNKMREVINNFIRKYKGCTGQLPYYGERVICRNNNWNMEKDGIALANGLIGTVLSVSNIADLEKEKKFVIDFKPDIVNTLFEDVEIDYKYFAGTYEYRKELKSDYKMKQYAAGELFEFAYAITTHLSQGSEHEKGIIFREYLAPQMQKALDYTAITRFKKSCIIVTK